MEKIRLKSAFAYYAGKQRMAGHILALIPEHTLYCEPFVGGGAVFFAKRPSKVEVLNDTNGEIINFYKVLKTQFDELKKMIDCTLHSRSQHEDSMVIYAYPHLFTEVQRAWALWVLAMQSFGSRLDGSWGYENIHNHINTAMRHRKEQLTKIYADRLQHVDLECADALAVIRSRDTAKTFFYCDPPYPGTSLGHFNRYDEQDYETLLKLLAHVKGRFLLSSYPSVILDQYIKEHRWHSSVTKQVITMAAKNKANKRKEEILVANYMLESPCLPGEIFK